MDKFADTVSNYLKAKLLPYLIIFFRSENYLTYKIGDLLDPPPKLKKKETTEEYLDRISAKQALRLARFEYTKMRISNAFYRVERPDLSMYEPESRETLEKLIDTLFYIEDEWEQHYHQALRRKMMEN